MKSKALIATLLAFLLLCTACGTIPAATTPMPTTPTLTTPAPTTPPDPFAALRASDESWIIYGLAAYESDKSPEDLRTFFASPANMVYLTLYDHMFVYDSEKSVHVAEALFRFIYDTYGAEALTDQERRIEYKNAYLTSLGLTAAYTQPAEVEQIMTDMDFTSTEQYPYVITIENATYYFEDFADGYISQYHAFLYYNTTGLRKMIAYLQAEGGEVLFQTDRHLNYYMTFDQTPYSVTTPAGDMKINDFSAALHEAVHAMGIHSGPHIWLAEGLCNYFGKLMGFNEQITASYIQTLMMTAQGYYDDAAAAGNANARYNKALLALYQERGGQYTSLADFDLRLLFDCMALAEMELGQYATIGDAYTAINQKESTHVGRNLSYAQATSLVAYLIDTYGLETVLEAQATQNIPATFGKEYVTLEFNWLNYLKQK